MFLVRSHDVIFTILPWGRFPVCSCSPSHRLLCGPEEPSVRAQPLRPQSLRLEGRGEAAPRGDAAGGVAQVLGLGAPGLLGPELPRRSGGRTAGGETGVEPGTKHRMAPYAIPSSGRPWRAIDGGMDPGDGWKSRRVDQETSD